MQPPFAPQAHAYRVPRCACAGRRLMLAAALLLLAAGLAVAAEVTYLVKPAQIKRAGTEQWVSLKLGDTVHAGDTIRTGNGARVEVSLGEERVFRIGQATEVELPDLQEAGGGKGLQATFNLILGRFWGGVLKPLKAHYGERFEVRTATATIGVKGTQFGVDHDKESGASQLAVVKGVVQAAPPPSEMQAPVEVAGPREIAPPQEISRGEWLLLVERDQKVTIRPGEVPQVEPLTEQDKQDEWIQFNLERDRALAQQ